MNHQTCHSNCLVLQEAVYKHGVPEFRYDETNIKGGGGCGTTGAESKM